MLLINFDPQSFKAQVIITFKLICENVNDTIKLLCQTVGEVDGVLKLSD